MLDKLINRLEGRTFWVVYTIEITLMVILIIYGLFSPNGFSAKGY